MSKEDYKCPFCHSHISKAKYDAVIHENKLLKEKMAQIEARAKENEARAKESEARAKEKITQLEAQAKKDKQDLKDIRKTTRLEERQRLGNRFKALKLEIKRLREGKTAQQEGFDYEKDLGKKFAQEFKQDNVIPTGKKGDVIIEIKSKGKIIGKLLIEIKKVAKHSTAHIEEVKRHKIKAKANVGILVTNGSFGKKRMDGFKNIEGILVIRPNSAFDFVKLLRTHITEIDSLKLSVSEKEKERAKLWNFIHSTEFETQMESIFGDIERFRKLDKKESSIIEKRTEIENSLLKAYDAIKEGIKHSRGK